jgi:hypothetical protein
VPGPFHRLESRTQTVADAKLQDSSKEIWGKPAANTAQSNLPCVIAVPCHRAREALNLRGLLCRSVAPEPHLRRGGISISQTVYYNEPMQLEQSMRQSRYVGSLMGSHNSLTGQSS